MCMNVNFRSPVKLFSFQNAPVLNESLIIHGNNLLWSKGEKEAIIEHAVEIYIYDIKHTEKGLNQIKLCQ